MERRVPKYKLHQITLISDQTEVQRLVGQQLSGIIQHAIITHFSYITIMFFELDSPDLYDFGF